MPTPKKLALMAGKIRETQEELMDFLLGKHPSEVMTIEAVRGFFRGKTDIQVFSYAKKVIFPHCIQIRTHNLDFFNENKNLIFKGLPQGYIDRYAGLIVGSPEDDILSIWKFFEMIISIYELSLKKKKNE
jgi:hypothetical protein